MRDYNLQLKKFVQPLAFCVLYDMISMRTKMFEERVVYLRRDSSETKKKILTVCVRLFLEQGYKNTSVSQIVGEAGVARGSYLNLFPTKDKFYWNWVETMFSGQIGVARGIADNTLPPVYAYAVETAIQLDPDRTERKPAEIYIKPTLCRKHQKYIYLHTTAELKQISGAIFPDDTESDFYEMKSARQDCCAAIWRENAISISR